MARAKRVTNVSANPDKFASVMSDLVATICGDVCEEAVGILREVSEETLHDVEATAPVSKSLKGMGGHHLKDAFRLDATVYASVGTAMYYNFGVPAKFIIHAPKWHKYSIVHLLEKGHVKAGFLAKGGLVPGQPFMVPAEDRAKQKIIQRLRQCGLTEQ